MENIFISGEKFRISLETGKNNAYISEGNFGEINLVKSALFVAVLKNIKTQNKIEISSLSFWQEVKSRQTDDFVEFVFKAPEKIENISIILKGYTFKNAVEWETEIVNTNDEWSVMSVSYPSPMTTSKYFDLFVPISSGRVIKNAGKKGFVHDSDYEFVISMHYFAVYGEQGGIYIGTEDPYACVKRYRVEACDDKADIRVDFIGIDANKPANSFKVAGRAKWQCFDGDWYDATMIYADFVYKKATWLPTIDENGRPDTPQRFKEVPVWIYDFMPNSEYHRDNVPKTLAKRNYPDDYWYNAVIELQKQLDVPVAYHVYNWHHIPFNVEYPHFMPARPEFIDGVKKLKQRDIYILPYINSVSWEGDDTEMGHEINYENTGKYGCAIKEDGTDWILVYPQTTVSGKNVDLCQMCPGFEKWHEINYNTVRQMEKELDIDGVYFDQIAANIGRPCYSTTHNHTTGGGSYWVDGYNKMMEKINAEKPKDSFYFSECNTEGYMKSFDGFLTWMWVASGEVPAYSAIYTGYIQLLGRMTGGKKIADKDFFKYCCAKSLLYGQQIGWCNADVIYDEERLEFFKKIVALRYKYKELFISSKMLRPPLVKCNLEPIFTTPNLKFKTEIEMDQVMAGAWQFKNKSKIVVFVTNTSNQEAEFELSFDAEEYGLGNYIIPEGFEICEERCITKGKLSKTECKAWEFDLKL